MSNLKRKIARHLSNVPGWYSNRKIVVIESDDWGSIRMPSIGVYQKLKDRDLDLESADFERYNLNDNLANEEDLESLFNLLNQFEDSKGSKPVITAVSLVANPDFEKIKAHNFEQYFYESFTQTLQRYGFNRVFELWKQGIRSHLFVPQFHGREHLNVPAWMRALQAGDSATRLAFDYGLWGFRNKHQHNLTYQAAFDLEFLEDLKIQSTIIHEGLELFEDIHGYKASFFVPPNGPFNNSLEAPAAEKGIKYLSSAKIQQEAMGKGKKRRVFHYLGQKNKTNQIYITRNCVFEPNLSATQSVDSCLEEIAIAFYWKKPAIISSHRVNYIGNLNAENRKNGLHHLKQLLSSIIQKWPDVEFMTSNELGDLISQSKH